MTSQTTFASKKITVIGSGSFGTALSHLWALAGHAVTLWGRNAKVIDAIRTHRVNPMYLDAITLADFKADTDLNRACAGVDLIVFTVPCQSLRAFLKDNRAVFPENALLVNTAKGVEQGSLMTPSQIFCDELGYAAGDRFAALSGPTFALELAQCHPSGAAIASRNRQAARVVQSALSCKSFRMYTSSDVLGVELGGALKNVMAIGTGIAEGLGFGLNTRAGLITRCLHEMIKLGVRMGANPLTFSGLSGLGDLVLTCTGELSRNRGVGIKLGRGASLKDVLSGMTSVAEGIATAQSAYQLAQKFEVDMPNSTYVYRILYEGLSPKQALSEILSRELKDEMQ